MVSPLSEAYAERLDDPDEVSRPPGGHTHLSADSNAPSAFAARRVLSVELGPPSPAVRGRLSLFVEGAIERALESRFAPPPGISANAGLDASLCDQLERARRAGAKSLELRFASLAGIANLEGFLDSQDSAVLRWWLRASREQPVRLVFDDKDLRLGIYGEPVPLGSLLEDTTARDEALLGVAARALAEQIPNSADTEWLHETLMQLSTPPPPLALAAETAGLTEAEKVLSEPVGVPELTPPSLEALCAAIDEPNSDSDEPSIIPIPPSFGEADEAAAEAAPAAPPAAPASEAMASGSAEPEIAEEMRERCASYCRELESANGPKPLSVIERQFVTAYMPLREAVDLKMAGADAARVLSDWSSHFEHSYREAFDAMRLRGKRPTMVLDIPELALRLSRLHGARSTQLLLVDAMRFDVGLAVHERLRTLAGTNAACVERQLLWAALPTTTATQVELIGRGPGGLREFTGEVEEEALVARGRKASTMRRLRTGRRELLKLDIVEARLSELSGSPRERIDAIATEVAERLAAHFEGVPERTLVLIFGDHGFLFDRENDVFVARQGGAMPEEVLVPAYAWLVGAVH